MLVCKCSRRRSLDRYVLTPHKRHVLIDLSWVVFEDYLLDKDDSGKVRHVDNSSDPLIRREWIDLIEKFPNNSVLGSDMVGNFTQDKYKKEIRKFDALLAQLKPDVAEQVAVQNWLRIVPKTGLTLPEGYKYPEFRYTQRSTPRRTRTAPIRSPDMPAAPWLAPRKKMGTEPATIR